MTIQCRPSTVGYLQANVVSGSSVMQFGDSKDASLCSLAIALQRGSTDFRGDEARFAAYPLFSLPLPSFGEDTGATLSSESRGNGIQVGNVRLLTVDASCYIRAGCGRSVTAEFRAVNIRHFNNQFPGHSLNSGE